MYGKNVCCDDEHLVTWFVLCSQVCVLRSVYEESTLLAMKKNEIMPFAWMDLEMIILSEVSQTEKKYQMTSLIYGI